VKSEYINIVSDFKLLNRKSEVTSVSNSITFRTLASPLLKVESVEHSRVVLVAVLDCRLELLDNNLNHPERIRENVCGSVKVYLKEILHSMVCAQKCYSFEFQSILCYILLF
jgi:hypothetical protein